VAAQPGSTPARIGAEHLDPALGRPGQVHEDADGRRLARAVRAEVAEDAALRHGQVESVEGDDRAEALGQSFTPDDRSVRAHLHAPS